MIRSVVLASALVAGFTSMARAEEVKLGYVDLQRALEETEEGRRAKAAIKKDFDSKQKELNEREEELKKAVEDLEKKRTLLPAEQVKAKEQEIQKKMADAQQTLMRHRDTLAQKENDAIAPLVDRMQRIIYKMAQSENFTMVLDKRQSGVIFAKTHLDLTNELIRRVNSGEESKGKAAAPAKPGATPAGGKAPAPAKK